MTNTLILVLLLYLSAMIAGSETALFTLSTTDYTAWKSSTLRAEKKAIQLLEHPKRLLATILIFNNLINISFITLVAYIIRQLIHSNHLEGLAILVAIFSLTTVVLFFGELLPKMYANQKGTFFIRRSIYLLQIAFYIFKPLANWMVSISNIAEKRIKKRGYKISIDELPEVIDEISLEENGSEKDREILKGIVNFSSITVQEIMTSRMNITALDMTMPFKELLEQIKINGYSRIPVYDETVDKIEGILYVKDVLPYLDKGDDFEWQKLLRHRYYVPENKKIDKLLKEFQAKHVHMAIVVDEYGGTAGLVTMEDIIEEIVGEINDESDEAEERLYTKIDDNTYLFESKIAMNDFCRVMQVDSEIFEEVRGESQSLGGLMLEMFSRFPKLNEVIKFDKFVFTIVSSTAKQIKIIKVSLTEEVQALD